MDEQTIDQFIWSGQMINWFMHNFNFINFNQGEFLELFIRFLINPFKCMHDECVCIHFNLCYQDKIRYKIYIKH
jgi:hypothetical protein